MAQPTDYSPSYNFTDWQTGNPTLPPPGVQLDAQFNAIATYSAAVDTNLKLIQRDDGQVANDSIGIDQLKPEITFGFNPPINWITAHAFAVRDAVWQGNAAYWCLIAHTSGVFATDLAAGKWQVIVDFTTVLANASTSATNAAASATTATTQATNASASATAAAGSATSASASATNAAASATSAATSASNAAATLANALVKANNLSDLGSVATSRTNLGVTATGADTTYAFRANNLSDLGSAATARTNLGVTATGADTAYNFRANNLSDVASAATARTNLAVPGTGTANTFTGKQTLSGGADVTPEATPTTVAVGYLGLPQNVQAVSYQLLMTDAGKTIYHTNAAAHTITVPANGTVAFPIGTIIKINAGSGSGVLTIAITTDTLRWIPSNTTGSRTLTAPGFLTLEKVSATEWWCWGLGVT